MKLSFKNNTVTLKKEPEISIRLQKKPIKKKKKIKDPDNEDTSANTLSFP